jgi:hypothetical protein
MNEFYGRTEASGRAEQLLTFCIYPVVTDNFCLALFCSTSRLQCQFIYCEVDTGLLSLFSEQGTDEQGLGLHDNVSRF